jgi:hypothetical protein
MSRVMPQFSVNVEPSPGNPGAGQPTHPVHLLHPFQRVVTQFPVRLLKWTGAVLEHSSVPSNPQSIRWRFGISEGTATKQTPRAL